jgi:hypothetical protein
MVGGKVGNGHDDYNKQLCRFLKRKKIDSIKIVKETLMLQGYDIQKKNRSLEKCQKMNVHFQLSEP